MRVIDIPAKYLPLTEETKQKIMAMSDEEWKKQIKKFNKEIKNTTTHAQD